jgi:hypothetical protein
MQTRKQRNFRLSVLQAVRQYAGHAVWYFPLLYYSIKQLEGNVKGGKEEILVEKYPQIFDLVSLPLPSSLVIRFVVIYTSS